MKGSSTVISEDGLGKPAGSRSLPLLPRFLVLLLARYWVPLLVLLTGIGCSLLATWQFAGTVWSKDKERFDSNVADARARISSRLDTYVAMLRAAAGLFASMPTVSADQFETYVERLELEASYPGIQGIGWSRKIAPEEQESIGRALRERNPRFRIWPEHDRDEYHSILFLEPLDRRNWAAIGYDMFTDPVRREAMMRARDEAAPAATGKVTLVQEIDERKQAGFLIYLPIYRGGDVPESVAARRAGLLGFVYSPFRADDLFAGIFQDEHHPRLHFRVFDGDKARREMLLHQSGQPDAAEAPEPRFAETVPIEVAGRRWTLQFWTRPEFELASGRTLVPAVLCAGLLTTLLLFALTLRLARGRDRLDEERRALEALNDAGLSLSSTLDLETLLQRATDAATALTGAQFGAFFYNVVKPGTESYMLYSLSGAPREAFARFPMPRNTAIFGPTFRGEPPVRLDDVTKDPRYGQNAPYNGMPEGHLPVRSYLAVPVAARRGEVFGGLFFGHPEPGVFSERDERIALGIAAQAAAGIDNARLHEQMAESEDKFRTLADSMPQLAWMARPDGHIFWFNRRWYEYTGTTPEQMEGSGWHSVLDPEILPRVRDRWERSVASGEPFEMIFPLRGADGRYRPFLSLGLPAHDRAGRISRWFGTNTDISEQVQADAAVRESRERLELAVAIAKMGTFEIDLSSDAVVVNEPGRAIYGWDTTHTTFSQVQSHFHPEDKAEVLRQVEAALEPNGSGVFEVEQRIFRTDGVQRWIRVRGQAFFEGEGPARRPVRCIGTYLDITERKEAEERLKEADRRKDEFLAMLAHELRNPLASVRNAAALLQISRAEDDRAWATEVIDRQVSHLSGLINDLLDVSRITRGLIGIKRERLEATRVFDASVESVRPLIEQRRHQLIVDLPRGELWLEADATRLEQVLTNLLSNAAKYTEPGGRIWLTAAHEENQIVIRVRDTGLGIEPELLHRVFDLFAQGDRSLARSEGGLGIGLTLVKKLVELHGGTVSAASEGPGKGSVFTVRLPTSTRPEAKQPVAERKSGTGADARGTRILVVDDNVDTADGLAKLLELVGHDVTIAHDGPSAIEAARTARPLVLLLDIGLPGMDGYELAQRLREEPCCEGARFIAVTGYGKAEDHRRSREAGFDHHLVKPIDFQLLTEVIEAAAG